MTVGFSNGDQYDSMFDYYAGNKPVLSEGADDNSEDNKQGFVVDRDHHVPLVASALMNSEGRQYGIAIDHRVPPSPEYDKFVAMHEAAELPHMQNLIAGGMHPTEAYHEAHDNIATPTESAAVRANGVRLGQDPDEYQDKYKQFWRDAAAIASQPTDKPVHPDAHTTIYGLDKAEGKLAQQDQDPDTIDEALFTSEGTEAKIETKTEEKDKPKARKIRAELRPYLWAGQPIDILNHSANLHPPLQINPDLLHE